MIARGRRHARGRRNPRTGLVGPDSGGTVISNSAAVGGAPPEGSQIYGTSEQKQTFSDQDWSGSDYGTLSEGIGKGIGGILSGIGDIISADKDEEEAAALPGAGGGGGGGFPPSSFSAPTSKPFPWSMVLLGLAAVGGVAFFALRGKDD
jgi:hypothetical protein